MTPQAQLVLTELNRGWKVSLEALACADSCYLRAASEVLSDTGGNQTPGKEMIFLAGDEVVRRLNTDT